MMNTIFCHTTFLGWPLSVIFVPIFGEPKTSSIRDTTCVISRKKQSFLRSFRKTGPATSRSSSAL